MRSALLPIPAHSFRTGYMTLQFPNKSRSFDDVKRTVRFHGYDGMFEVRFLIEATALLKKANSGDAEADYLNAFDRSRPEIQKAAIRVYERNRRSAYTLTASDLK
jgi:hypothetical protein